MIDSILELSNGQIAKLLRITIISSTVIAILLGTFLLRRQRSAAHKANGLSAPTKRTFCLSRLWLVALHPFAQFLVMIALLWVNQILFNAYVLKFQRGSLRFIHRQFGDSWFALDRDNSAVHYVIAHAHDGGWLAYSVLRAQAFLELPFIVFGYLAVGWLLGRRVYRALVNPVMLVCMSVSYTIALMSAELVLRNRFTADDLLLRIIACVFVPIYVTMIERSRMGRFDRQIDDSKSGYPALFVFVLGAIAIGYLLLASYDAFLLYNLRYLPSYAGGMLISVAVAAAAIGSPALLRRTADDVTSTAIHSAGAEFCRESLGGFLVIFFIPALSLRYIGIDVLGPVRGSLMLAMIVAATVVGSAFAYGFWCWREFGTTALRAADVLFLLLVLAMAASAAVLAGGSALTFARGSRIAEVPLMWAVGAALASGLAVFAASDAVRKSTRGP